MVGFKIVKNQVNILFHIKEEEYYFLIEVGL